MMDGEEKRVKMKCTFTMEVYPDLLNTPTYKAVWVYLCACLSVGVTL